MTGLADCNNFFVSCERSVHPELEGKAVVVMSNNDGCIVARSNEAKRMGIRMGQPVFEIKDMVRDGRVIAISGHHMLYKEISIKVHDIFRRYAPSCIDYSVDEAFMDMSGIPEKYLADIGEHIHAACLAEARIPVTIGFAATKTLAKIATETAKKAGISVRVLNDEADIRRALEAMPIGDLWGIGRRLVKRLYFEGVHTVAQFADKDLIWIRNLLGVNGERSWLELHGQPCIELSHVGRQIQESVSETRTFPTDIDDYEYIRTRIAMYAEHCAAKLRAMNGMCHKLGVMLCTNRFSLDVPRQTLWTEAVFNQPEFRPTRIVGAALAGLDHIYNPEFPYKRGGVFLMEIQPRHRQTGSLFDDDDPAAEEPRKALANENLLAAVDRINAEAGGGVLLSLAGGWTSRWPSHNDGYSSSFQFRK